MLSPNELEYVPDKIKKLYRGLQLDILSDIVERLAVNHDISRTADWEISRLYELGVAKEDIRRHIRRTLGLTAEEIERIYSEVLAEDYARYAPIYQKQGKSFIPFKENRQLQQLIGGVKTQTNAEFKNITQSLGFAIKKADGTRTFLPLSKAYQTVLDKAAFGMLSGVYDYNTMIKQAVKELTDSGLRAVDYYTEQDDGSMKIHTNRVEVAARRALMTGFNQVVAKVTEDNAEQLGTDRFEVTYHRGARPTHQPWQGRVYTREQLVTVCGYGDVTGLKGANCYHDFHPFFPGISKRLYTDEQLDKWNAEENTPKEYKGKKYTVYEALQRQRKLETALRRKREEIALLEKGSADEDDIIAAKAKYHALSSEYVEFSKAMNLPQQRERISIDGRKGVDVSFGKPAEIEDKTVANSGKSGIIKAKKFEPLPPEKVVPVLREDSKEWVQKLTSEETRSVKKYTKNIDDPADDKFYARLNAMLRGEIPKDDTLEYYSNQISSAISKFELKHDIVCYRTLDSNVYKNFKVGSVFNEPQFISTSVAKSKVLKKPFSLVIHVPEGSNGAYIELLSSYPVQREFIINSNSVFRVKSKSKDTMELELIKWTKKT